MASSFGKIATEAGKRIKQQAAHYAKNKGEMANFGPATRGKLTDAMAGAPGVARTTATGAPRGANLASDAKNIKIRQTYEDIPEARVDRPGAKRNRR